MDILFSIQREIPGTQIYRAVGEVSRLSPASWVNRPCVCTRGPVRVGGFFFFCLCVLTMRQHNVLQGANHIEINDLACGK